MFHPRGAERDEPVELLERIDRPLRGDEPVDDVDEERRPGHAPALEDGRLLLFRCAECTRSLWCSHVNLHELDEAQLRPLPLLLREILRDMPHVVGAAWVDETMYWLVDLSRLVKS